MAKKKFRDLEFSKMFNPGQRISYRTRDEPKVRKRGRLLFMKEYKGRYFGRILDEEK